MLDLSLPEYAHALERLRDDPMIWLASVRPDGRPHLAAVWFHFDGERILIFSKPATQKVRNLRANSAVTLGLDDTHGGEDAVTVEGRAELVSMADVSAAMPAYTTKYAAGIAQLFQDPDRMIAEYSQPIRITPTRILTVS
jgi:PPOX class probable F420-dependent enzyme